jgi:hypothetical protein
VVFELILTVQRCVELSYTCTNSRFNGGEECSINHSRAGVGTRRLMVDPESVDLSCCRLDAVTSLASLRFEAYCFVLSQDSFQSCWDRSLFDIRQVISDSG